MRCDIHEPHASLSGLVMEHVAVLSEPEVMPCRLELSLIEQQVARLGVCRCKPIEFFDDRVKNAQCVSMTG